MNTDGADEDAPQINPERSSKKTSKLILRALLALFLLFLLAGCIVAIVAPSVILTQQPNNNVESDTFSLHYIGCFYPNEIVVRWSEITNRGRATYSIYYLNVSNQNAQSLIENPNSIVVNFTDTFEGLIPVVPGLEYSVAMTAHVGQEKFMSTSILQCKTATVQPILKVGITEIVENNETFVSYSSPVLIIKTINSLTNVAMNISVNDVLFGYLASGTAFLVRVLSISGPIQGDYTFNVQDLTLPDIFQDLEFSSAHSHGQPELQENPFSLTCSILGCRVSNTLSLSRKQSFSNPVSFSLSRKIILTTRIDFSIIQSVIGDISFRFDADLIDNHLIEHSSTTSFNETSSFTIFDAVKDHEKLLFLGPLSIPIIINFDPQTIIQLDAVVSSELILSTTTNNQYTVSVQMIRSNSSGTWSSVNLGTFRNSSTLSNGVLAGTAIAKVISQGPFNIDINFLAGANFYIQPTVTLDVGGRSSTNPLLYEVLISQRQTYFEWFNVIATFSFDAEGYFGGANQLISLWIISYPMVTLPGISVNAFPQCIDNVKGIIFTATFVNGVNNVLSMASFRSIGNYFTLFETISPTTSQIKTTNHESYLPGIVAFVGSPSLPVPFVIYDLADLSTLPLPECCNDFDCAAFSICRFNFCTTRAPTTAFPTRAPTPPTVSPAPTPPTTSAPTFPNNPCLNQNDCFNTQQCDIFVSLCVGSGNPRISLYWNNADDLDLHVLAPPGEPEIYFSNKVAYGGRLDVDIVPSTFGNHIENVYWPNDNTAPFGVYRYRVVYFSGSTATWTMSVYVGNVLVANTTGNFFSTKTYFYTR